MKYKIALQCRRVLRILHDKIDSWIQDYDNSKYSIKDYDKYKKPKATPVNKRRMCFVGCVDIVTRQFYTPRLLHNSPDKT